MGFLSRWDSCLVLSKSLKRLCITWYKKPLNIPLTHFQFVQNPEQSTIEIFTPPDKNTGQLNSIYLLLFFSIILSFSDLLPRILSTLKIWNFWLSHITHFLVSKLLYTTNHLSKVCGRSGFCFLQNVQLRLAMFFCIPEVPKLGEFNENLVQLKCSSPLDSKIMSN